MGIIMHGKNNECTDRKLDVNLLNSKFGIPTFLSLFPLYILLSSTILLKRELMLMFYKHAYAIAYTIDNEVMFIVYCFKCIRRNQIAPCKPNLKFIGYNKRFHRKMS